MSTKSKSQRIRDLLAVGTDLKPDDIAEKFGCTATMVYDEIRKHNGTAKPRAGRNDQPTLGNGPAPSLQIALRLGDLGQGGAEIKIRNDNDNMLGTLVITSGGLSYRRPNQKAAADRKLTWAILDKLMQIGIA